VLGPGGVEEDKHEIALILFDPWGRRIDTGCEITLPQEEKGKPVRLQDGTARIDAKRAGTCKVVFTGFAKAEKLLKEPPDLPLDPLPNAELLTRRDQAKAFKKSVRSVAHVFQLARKKATIIELEHFTADGAVFLPGFSPAELREAAPHVTGIDALEAVFARCENEKHVLVAGHHASLSEERAQSVQFLLMGNRFAWAALSARVAKPEDKAHVRAWASEPLPEDDAAWTIETWGKVFDLYVKALVPPQPDGPPQLATHPYIVARYGKNFVPHQVALDAHFPAGDYVKMNALNPTKPLLPHDRGWKPVWPGETVYLPDAWDDRVELLRAAGWDAHHGERVEPKTPEPPHLEHAPRAVGCGDRHLEHPYAKAADRRAETRHVEIVVLPDDALVCSHDGPCDTSACEVYDPMAYELLHTPFGRPRRVVVRWIVPEKYGRQLILRSKTGEVRAKIPISAAGPAGSGFIAFDLSPHFYDEPLDLLMVEEDALVAPAVSLNVRAIFDVLRTRNATLPAGAFDVRTPGGAAHGD
jgi:hypothetical protein